MSLTQRQLLRIATDVHTQLQTFKLSRQQEVQNTTTHLIEQMNRLVTTRRKLIYCQIRKWQAAGKKVGNQIEAALKDIPYRMHQVENAIKANNIQVPPISEIFRELIQANEEFTGLDYYTDAEHLVVATDPIRLNDIYLGEFEIQLHIPSLAEMRYNEIYNVIALDPHPAASNDSVTHPHVSDEKLCSGAAEALINMALISGRICDFFMLVRSVLTNYNLGSPYVPLENWFGTPCYDCGHIMDDENIFTCLHCENSYCSECSDYCRLCHDSTCRSCLSECSACEDIICHDCTTTCPWCGKSLCKTCLDDMLCPCIEEHKELEDEETEEVETTVA